MRHIVAGMGLLIAVAAPAAVAEVGLGIKAGTLGVGVEGTFALAGGLNLRAGVNNYTYGYSDSASDINYDIDLELESYALLLDWHPFSGTFKLTAGLLSNKNHVVMRATPAGPVTIGGNTQNAGTLRGEVNFKKTAPYAGLGWGNAAGKTRGFGFSAELGVLFQGAPDVTLTSSNPAVPQSDLDAEAREIENDLDDLKAYPVISFGFSYQF